MASAYLQKQITATNTTAITFSAWVKRSKLGYDAAAVFQTENNSSDYLAMVFNGSDKIDFQITGTQNRRITTRVFRDTNAWYHILVAIDSSQGSADDRIKLYINGSQETSFDTKTTNMSQGSNLSPIDATLNYAVGYYPGQNTNYFDGQMAHVHYVVGTAYTPSTFGETDSTTGIWKPKVSPTGVNYGSKGFFLKFDNSANMGLDSSGLTNNLTVSGTIIQTKDTPSNVYATGNILIKGANSQSTASNIALTATSGQNSWEILSSTLAVNSGKWYAEFKMGANIVECGIMDIDQMTTSDIYPGSVSRGFGYRNNGDVYKGGSGQSGTFASYTAGDIIGVAMDMTNNKLYLSKNGTFQNSGDPTSGSTGTGALSIDSGYNYCFVFAAYNGNISANFGNGQFGTSNIASAGSNGNGSLFEYDVPTGYYALNTENIGTQS